MTFAVTDLGVSGIQGLVIGCLSRFIVELTTQIIKWFLLIQFGILKFLESRDIIIVDWEKLSWGLIEISQDVAEQSVSIIVSIMETGAFGVGFLGGYTMLGNIDFKKSLKI
jgi:uncharacterized membrane protein (Fun14 family)